MSRSILGVVFAVGCVAAGAASAQDTTVKSKTKVSGGDPTTVTYTGCVQSGPETRSYVLNKVVPVSQTTETTTTAGTPDTTTTTTTSYALVPGDTVQITEYVGHKVEVTGMLIPGGDVKSETTTKTEREGAPDTKKKETVKAEGALPQFRVISMKTLADRCE